MHIVAINGSPQEHGSTKVLLEHVLAPLEASGWSTEIIQLGGSELKSCEGCTRCFKGGNGLCAEETDGFNTIYARMLKSNAIILGSPAGFNASLIPEVNNFINRSAYLASANRAALAGKVGAAVIDVPRGSFIEAHDKAHRFFLRSKMIVPGISGWCTDAKRLHKHRKVNDVETLEQMRTLGEMINWLGRAVEPHLGKLPMEKNNALPMFGQEGFFQAGSDRESPIAKKDFNLPMLLQDMYSEPQGR